LSAAEEAGFDLFITADQELSYQQNLAGRKIAVLVLSTNNWSVVKANMPEITTAINAAKSGSFAFVDIGHSRGLTIRSASRKGYVRKTKVSLTQGYRSPKVNMRGAKSERSVGRYRLRFPLW
jgi:argininosuccinate synthase